MTVEIVPVIRDRWPDMEGLFTAKGSPGFCWCAAYRFRDAHTMERQDKQAAMRQLVDEGVPIGVLAIDHDEPIGWCSIAPRATYARLARSRVMPTVDEDAWTLLCLFVRREHREGGVAGALVDGATAWAAERGASVVEAYPWDTAGLRQHATSPDPTMHFGHSQLYRAAGFEREGSTRRWVKHV